MKGFRAGDILRCVLVAVGIFAVSPGTGLAADITVFAAASLKDALDEVADRYAEETGNRAVMSYAASSVLARQIQYGAPADVFISANVDWMDLLQRDSLIDTGSRFDLVGNHLVLIAHDTTAEKVTITPDFDLAGLLGDGYLAMALVDAVPVGIYGRVALDNLGLWESVSARVAQTDNARAALALVSSGEAPFGIVYATDAGADRTVGVIATFPAAAHPPIVYPAASVARGQGAAAAAFLGYLRQPEAAGIFRRHGFDEPKAGTG